MRDMRELKNDASLYCRDMDGTVIHAGDSAVCLALPERQPCLVRILKITSLNSVEVSNGRVEMRVPSESCILRDVAYA